MAWRFTDASRLFARQDTRPSSFSASREPQTAHGPSIAMDDRLKSVNS